MVWTKYGVQVLNLKKCFELVGNCGMIGGRPNQALYFLGYVDDEVLYLDPHTTQRSGTVGQKTSQDEIDFDETFHHKYAGRLHFAQMDPSLAVISRMLIMQLLKPDAKAAVAITKVPMMTLNLYPSFK
ncbi:Cysteine protease ATG4B [Eumeta japonica]|uniref:Cysteine protease n=1 Tax=Eumeta variegata TaxID=151549 RepID=A0A4C1TQ46_EUMVA|nr:Cysteine protease ATG4B [Eumeta japonica]